MPVSPLRTEPSPRLPWWAGGPKGAPESMESAAAELNKNPQDFPLGVPKYLWYRLMQKVNELAPTSAMDMGPATIAGGGPIWKGGGIWGKGLGELDPNIANQIAKTMRPDVKTLLAEKFKSFQGRPTFQQLTSAIEADPNISTWADQARLAASGKARNIVPTKSVVPLEPDYFAKRVSPGPIEDAMREMPLLDKEKPLKEFLADRQKVRETLQGIAPSGEVFNVPTRSYMQNLKSVPKERLRDWLEQTKSGNWFGRFEEQQGLKDRLIPKELSWPPPDYRKSGISSKEYYDLYSNLWMDEKNKTLQLSNIDKYGIKPEVVEKFKKFINREFPGWIWEYVPDNPSDPIKDVRTFVNRLPAENKYRKMLEKTEENIIKEDPLAKQWADWLKTPSGKEYLKKQNLDPTDPIK